MIIPDKFEAIYSLVGGGITQQADGNIIYHDGQTPPSDSAIATELTKLISEYDALQFQRDRQYPQLGEQLDLLFHDMTAGKGTKDGEWYKAVLKVKTDNPKPE